MSIRRKINLTFALGFGLTLLLAVTGIWASLDARTKLTRIASEYATARGLAWEIQHAATSALSQQRALIARVVQGDRSATEDQERKYRAERTLMADKLNALRGVPSEDGERKAVMDELGQLSSAWDEAHGRFWNLALKGQSPEMASMCRSEVTPLAAKVAVQTTRLVELEGSATKRMTDEALNSLGWQIWLAGGIALVAMVVLLVGSLGLRGGLRELGKALTDMGRMAEEVTQAAGSVSNTSQSLATGTTRQAASTEETAASATEVKSMAQRNSESAREAARIVTDAQEKFDGAHLALGRMEDTMGGIEASASKIARIIKVIDDIAFQTNILSLNAAVEAARAGDAGMGFAVVADEVRGLAQRCATAAQETEALINESIARSSEGKLVAADVAGTIRAITTETLSIRTLVEEVSVGSEEQARALDQISTAIGQIERVTQDSAANAEEAAAASEELTAQAAELRLIAQRLTTLTGGDADEAPVVRRVAKPPAVSPWTAPSASAKPQRPSATTTTFADDDDQDFRPF